VVFSADGDGGVVVLRTGRQSLGILVMLTFTAVMDARVCVWEETMFLLARYAVAAAVFLSASAASAVEDATLSADQVLPACAAFIADRAPREIDGVFQAGGRYIRRGASRADEGRFSSACSRGDAEDLAVQVTEGDGASCKPPFAPARQQQHSQ
jgi:hypothetical protein